MKVRARTYAAVAAVLLTLAACSDDDEDIFLPDPNSSPGDGSGPESTDALADLDALIANADAYLYVAEVLREDGGSSTLDGSAAEPLVTDLFASFERATVGDMAVRLTETRDALVERTTIGCTIDGRYDGVSFDDTPDEEDADSAFSEYVSAGDELPVSDGTRALGALRPGQASTDVPDDGPHYEWELPNEVDRTTLGTLSVEVPGDVFPGLGTLALSETPLVGLTSDGPLTVESTVHWEPTDESGTIVIGLDLAGEGVSEDGERDRLEIQCITADDGEFRLPDATLARLPEAVDDVQTLSVERTRIDVVPMGEAIVLLGRRTLRFVLEVG